MGVPVTNKMKTLRKTDINFILLRTSVGLIAESAPSIGWSWTSSFNHMYSFIRETCKELPTRLALPKPRLSIYGKVRQNLG